MMTLIVTSLKTVTKGNIRNRKEITSKKMEIHLMQNINSRGNESKP